MKEKKKAKQGLCLLLLAAALTIPHFALPARASAAETDIRLRFELQTDSKVSELQAGQQIEVNVTVGRSDGKMGGYPLIGAQMDIAYDNELFEASDFKSAGLKRPDGEPWKGSVNCMSIKQNAAGKKGVRVLYTNLSLVGGMNNVDTLTGNTVLGSFVLTARKTLPGEDSSINFSMTESIGSDLKKEDHDAGAPLIVHFAGPSGSQDGSGSGNGSGSGSGTGSGSGSEGGSENNGSGSNGGSGSEAKPGATGSQSADPNDTSAFDQLRDVPEDHWARAAIRYLAINGVISGNEEKRFEPEKAVTRAEFCRMVAGVFGYEAETTSEKIVFQDVRPDLWHYAYIMPLSNSGVISGKGNGVFGAEEPLSRQDMAVILRNAMKDKNVTLSAVRQYRDFTDEAGIEEYARKAVREMYCADIISGMEDGAFAPGENTSKAQAAAVLYNIATKK